MNLIRRAGGLVVMLVTCASVLMLNVSTVSAVTTACSQALHDSYTTVGPDGLTYPTWHPAVYPGGKPGFTDPAGCVFGHEHGSNPTDTTLQVANNTAPPFGYLAHVAGVTEAHEGYKVVVIGHQWCDANNHDNVFPADIRAVMHTGSHAMGRFTTQLHSLEYSYLGYDIRYKTCVTPQGQTEFPIGAQSTLNMAGLSFVVQGMADTRPAAENGTVCDVARMTGKTFSGINEVQTNVLITTGSPQNYTGNCVKTGQPQSAYEIWGMVLDVCPNPVYSTTGYCGPNQSALYVEIDPAVNNPITTLNFQSYTQLNYTQSIVNPTGPSPTSTDSAFLGCDRETTQGTKYWHNPSTGGYPVWYTKTDASDAQPTQDATHPLRQQVSFSVATDLTGFYDRDDHENYCSPGISVPN